MPFVIPIEKLRLLLHDLELSYGRVDVLSEQQLQVSCVASAFTADEAALLLQAIGIRAAPNTELPAVIVFQKLSDWIAQGGLVIESPKIEYGRLEKVPSVPESLQETESSKQESFADALSSTESSTSKSQTPSTEPSLVDTSFIQMEAKGYTGSLLDRHMEYSLRDTSQVHPLEVRRRFTDFVELREYLLAKYPTRTVPRLPIKSIQIFTDDAFIEDRMKGLKRFLGIVYKHPVYKHDQAVQAFFNQLSFKVPDVPSRQDALTAQIPTAEALMHGTSEAEQVLVQKASIDLQKLSHFLTTFKDLIKSIIKQKQDEANTFMSLSSCLKESNEIVDALCRGCAECNEAIHQRRTISAHFEDFIGRAEGSTLTELQALEERMALMLELFGAFSELLARAPGLKYKGFPSIDSEIAATERDYEKLRTRPDQESVTQESVDKVRARIDSLRADRQQHETHDRFVQYCLWEEVKWIHAHKPSLNLFLSKLTQTLALNSEQLRQSFQ